MQRILIIEPVEWSAEIDTAGPHLATVKEPDTVLESAWVTGLTSIEGWVDEARCAPLVVDIVAARADEFDAMMINCFADPGLRAAREIARVPVVGAAEASLCLAMQLGHRLGVISASSLAARDVHLLAQAYGVPARLAGAVGVDIPIVDLEKDTEATTTALIAAGRACIERYDADVLILGCTGMMPLAAGVRAAFDVPVIEPMVAAFKTAEALARLGLVHAPTELPGGCPPD
jgi:allantoin racemase